MTMLSLHYFISDENAALRLAEQLGVDSHVIQQHPFPDGESKIQVVPASGSVIIYMSLNDPDSKLIQLAFAAEALRESGATRLILVAPYLCYMRQDKAFNQGEAVSQRIIASYLSGYFDRIITVDPHLHRTRDLQDIFPDCQVHSLLATAPIAQALKQESSDRLSLLVGPDSESRQWVHAISDLTGIAYLVGEKVRHGDRSVSIELPCGSMAENVHAIIVDDVISSGMTIVQCAEQLHKAGAESIEVITSHIVCSSDDLERIYSAGVTQVRSTDSVQHNTNAIHLAPLLSVALAEER